jgi:hypothetical protein
MVMMMMMIDDVELISGIHIASRMFVNFFVALISVTTSSVRAKFIHCLSGTSLSIF